MREGLQWLRAVGAPRSLFMRIRALRPARPKNTQSLYVVMVDFPMDPQKRAEYDKALEPIAQKYGLDFFIVEPGVRVKPFNEL
jgi:hypothetical protein